jgi:ferrochelatase
VWLPDGSPLMVHTVNQTNGVRDRLADEPVVVDFAMRYGNPSIAEKLDGLAAKGIERVVVIPLYPQYSTTTVATIQDKLDEYAAAHPSGPKLVTIDTFPEDAGYIEARAGLIEGFWAEHGRPDFAAGDKLLLSYHGIPESLVTKGGDPYPSECEATTALLRTRLGLDETSCVMTYQSKFGPGKWLTPATIDTSEELGKQKLGRLDVFCPGFAADCLETDEEINQLNRETFTQAGGGQFNKIPCLNDDPAFLDVLARLAAANLE